jgi:broad specificity phosphatase PhoE
VSADDDKRARSSQHLTGMPGALDVAFLLDGSEHCHLILVRHGQQDFPDLRVTGVAGMVDPPLSDIGRRQAELVGARYAVDHLDAVYASPLLRAYDTGVAVAGHHGLEVQRRDDLREIEVYRDMPQDRPLLEMLGRERLLGYREQMIRHRRWDVYPGTESSQEFRRRCCSVIDGIASSHQGETVVVACHGGVINAYLADLIGTPTDMLFRPAHTSASVFRVARGGRRAIETIGDCGHLMGTEGLVTY